MSELYLTAFTRSCLSPKELSWVGIEPTTSGITVRATNHETSRPVKIHKRVLLSYQLHNI